MKFNWKSLIPLALAIFAPQLAVLSSKTGVAITPITPAMIGNFSFGMIFFSISDVLPMIQPALLIVGGFLADGAVTKGLTDWKTNITAFLTSGFGLLSGFGIIFAPTLKENIISFGAMIVALLSKHPEDAAVSGQ